MPSPNHKYTARETAIILDTTEAGLHYKRNNGGGPKWIEKDGQIFYTQKGINKYLDNQLEQATQARNLSIERMEQIDRSRKKSA